MHLIFEQTTSALYYSNDGRLRLSIDPGDGEQEIEIVLSLDGNEVFRTLDRVKADAYIAGYDLARSAEITDDATHCEECGLAAEDGHMPSCSLYDA